jgi:hypothetical protein
MPQKRLTWTNKDREQAQLDGWDIFRYTDPVQYLIESLDDPQGNAKGLGQTYKGPKLNGMDAGIKHVRKLADQKNPLAVKAMEILRRRKSPQASS